MSACLTTGHLTIHQGAEFSSTAYRRAKNQTTIIPIPVGFEARMRFARDYTGAPVMFTLTSSPAAGLTINYVLGEIAIYLGATVTLPLDPSEKLKWEIEIYDPLDPDVIVFLGSGSASVCAQVG
jgi:hypothetical protein